MNHSPLNCVVPPHLLAKIIELGSQEQRDKAIQTVRQTNQLRTQRQFSPAPPANLQKSAAAAKLRSVYSAEFQAGLPGKLVRQEGGPATGDPAADEAYEGGGATYDLFWDIYQRNSIDGSGMRLNSTVHYQKGYDNAFWNGTQMVYGDGDEDLPASQRLFNRFTIALDVIGHELTHGVTQFTANLNYEGQSGALNESFSDVFGSLVKQRRLGHTAAAADWIIGQGLFTANVKGQGIRSLKAPGSAYDDPVLGKDPQPAHMKDYVNTADDNGGVHINSGIPNRAFYLASLNMGGFAWEKAGRIWYVTLQSQAKPNSNFQDAANLTAAVAGDLFGKNSLEQQAVSAAWAEVGLNLTAVPPVPTPAPGCLPTLFKKLGIPWR
jgi:Zn-dependent metalloprotease